jgi:hypothetical protein
LFWIMPGLLVPPKYQVSMPKDEDRSLLIWISPVFDTERLAWMITIVNVLSVNGNACTRK